MIEQRGWIGIGMFLLGIGMLFMPQTSSLAPFAIGFGSAMTATGIKKETTHDPKTP